MSQESVFELLDTPAAAKALGLSPRTLEKYRISGNGPAFLVLGARACRYHPRDLEAWLNARRFASTSEVQRAA